MGWKTPRHYATLASTNDVAIRLAKEGAEEGEIIIADAQTAGRGRSGRTWESPAGKNLYLSVLLRPDCSPARATLITLVAGVALHEALSPFVPPSSSLKIKWPNDLYLKDRKVAGLLTEMESEGEKVKWVVAGIGVDVNADEADFSPDVRKIATSLKITIGREIDRAQLTERLLKSFEKHYRQFLEEGPSTGLAYCDQHSYLKGRRVQANGVEGTAAGLTPDGYLQVRKDDGEIVSIVSGEIVLLPNE